MSAIRYCGALRIRVTYRDPVQGAIYNNGTPIDPNGSYRCVVSCKGEKRREVVWVGAPRHLSHAVDSSEAFDDAARAALAFASGDLPLGDGFPVDDYAEFDDSGYAISRKVQS